MQRREKRKKAARDLVRARTLARGVTRNGTENGESGLAAVLVRREGAQLKNLSRLSHLSCATTPCDGHVRPVKRRRRADSPGKPVHRPTYRPVLSRLSRLSRDSEARQAHATARSEGGSNLPAEEFKDYSVVFD
jgi:hypothetical protein